MVNTWVTPNRAQRQALQYIRNLLAEKGYLIFDAPEWYRRSDVSFLATQKEFPIRFLAVQPTQKGWISITPFRQKSNYVDVRNLMPFIRKNSEVTVRLMNYQMAYEKIKDDWWEVYFPPEAQEELRLLGRKPK